MTIATEMARGMVRRTASGSTRRASARAWALAALGLALAIAGGCTVKVDAEGKPITGQVWFDDAGAAHCPYCEPVGEKSVAPPDERPAPVKPYHNRCEAGHEVVWGTDELPCQVCSGAGDCPSCFGSGIDRVAKRFDRPCPDCIVLVDGNPASQGRCHACLGHGTVKKGEHGQGADGLDR